MALRIYLALSMMACAVSCTPRGIDTRDAPLAAEHDGLAVIRIERSFPVSALPERASVSTVVDAVFARYQGIGPDDVLALLGWPARTEPLAGCQWGATEGADLLPVDAAVDLLDVGPIHIDVGGEPMMLEGRLFPSVQSLVAGTIYAEETTSPSAVLVGPSDAMPSEYRLVSAGVGSLGQLESVVSAPAPPSGVIVDGRPLEPGLELERRKHVTVQWDAGDPTDRVEIELRAGGRVLRCTASDQGSFVVRVEALSALPPDPGARLGIGRVRREPLDVSGIDEAFARLVSRRTMPIALR